MKFSDLITDPKDNRISHTKVWSHIGMCAMTAVFVYRAFYGNIQDMEFEYWAYGLLVTAPNMVGKFLSFRFGKDIKNNVSNNQEESNGN